MPMMPPLRKIYTKNRTDDIILQTWAVFNPMVSVYYRSFMRDMHYKQADMH